MLECVDHGYRISTKSLVHRLPKKKKTRSRTKIIQPQKSSCSNAHQAHMRQPLSILGYLYFYFPSHGTCTDDYRPFRRQKRHCTTCLHNTRCCFSVTCVTGHDRSIRSSLFSPEQKKNGICCIDNSYKDTFIIAIIYSAKCVYIMCLCMCDTADTRRGSKKKTYYDSAQRQNLHHLLLLLHITFVSFLLKWLAVQRPRRTICGRNRLGSINLMYVGFVIFLLLTSAVDVFLSLQNLSAVCVCVFVGLLLFNSIMLWLLLLLLLLLLPRLARSLQGGKRSVVVDRF